MKRDMYQEITDSVLESLQKGTIPWEKPWSANAKRVQPRSVSTGKVYRGINWMLLSMMQGMYESPWWLTFKQARKLGGAVKKGEKATVVVLWQFIDQKHPAGHPKFGQPTGKRIPILKHFNVFNLDQCDMPEEVTDRLAKRLDRVAGPHVETGTEIKGKNVEIAHSKTSEYLDRENIQLKTNSQIAAYSPSTDTIMMPEVSTFNAAEAYLATLLHECVHSTGIKKRLDRGIESNGSKGSESYAREELVAELGSAFAASRLGIDVPVVTDNRDAYIANWMKALEQDKKAIIWAAGRAEKATKFMLGEVDEDAEPESKLEYNKK